MMLNLTPRYPTPSLYGSEISSEVQDDIIAVADFLQATHGIGDGRNVHLMAEDILATELDQMLGAQDGQAGVARNGQYTDDLLPLLSLLTIRPSNH